jgi:hypothetical protein
MATSFTRTREQMRDMIARKLGIKEEGQSLSAEDAAIINEGMDLRLKQLHARNVLWWNVGAGETNVTLTAGVATATLTPTDVLFPVSLRLPVGTDTQPVRIVGHSEYQEVPDKTERGEPEMAFFSGSTVYLWPVPQTNYTAKLTYQSIATDTANGVTPDVPVSMLLSFAAVVADDLIEDFKISEPMKVQRLAMKAKEGMRDILALNAERVDSAPVAPEWY